MSGSLNHLSDSSVKCSFLNAPSRKTMASRVERKAPSIAHTTNTRSILSDAVLRLVVRLSAVRLTHARNQYDAPLLRQDFCSK